MLLKASSVLARAARLDLKHDRAEREEGIATQ